jgi:hypothetical protein
VTHTEPHRRAGGDRLSQGYEPYSDTDYDDDYAEE